MLTILSSKISQKIVKCFKKCYFLPNFQIILIGRHPLYPHRGGTRTNLKEGQLVVGAQKNFQKLVMRVRHIQKFHVLKGRAALLLLGEGGATAPRCPP